MNAGTCFHLLVGDPPKRFVSQRCLGRDDLALSEHWIAGLVVLANYTFLAQFFEYVLVIGSQL